MVEEILTGAGLAVAVKIAIDVNRIADAVSDGSNPKKTPQNSLMDTTDPLANPLDRPQES
ncbi:MAG: hypothetical protein JWP81_3953 [Ferruginibacter sp.]|nr:hypothetical protein [Ferruginibacter sp.]